MNPLAAFNDMDAFSMGIALVGGLVAILSLSFNLQVPGLFSTGELSIAGLVMINLGFTLGVFVQSQEVEYLDHGGSN